MVPSQRVLLALALFALAVLILNSIVGLGHGSRAIENVRQEEHGEYDEDMREELDQEEGAVLLSLSRRKGATPLELRSPSLSPSPEPSVPGTASRTSSRTLSLAMTASTIHTTLPLRPIPSHTPLPLRMRLASQFSPLVTAESLYDTLLQSTTKDLELLAPGVTLPVDGCQEGIPCLRGDVILFHQGRCGSHELMEPLGLNLQPEEDDPFPWGFSRYAEGFNSNAGFVWEPYEGKSRDEMLQDGLRQVTARIDEVRKPNKRYFLSLKINQIRKTGLSAHDFLTLLAAYGFRHIVIIYRNPIRVRVSYMAAGQLKDAGVRNPFHEREDQNANCMPVEYALRKVKTDFDETEKGYQAALEHPAFLHPITLQYERDLYDGPYDAAERVLKELHVNAPVRRMELLRTTDCPLSELVTNWDEVKRMVEASPYSWALEPNGVQEPLPMDTENLLRMCPVEPTDSRPAFVRCSTASPVWGRRMRREPQRIL